MAAEKMAVNEVSSMESDSVSAHRRAAVMADVARVAGVSAQTVSRVANGEMNVRAATRRRVVEAMREVGYRPNGAARALKRGSFNTIGVITFTLSTFGNSHTLDAVTTSLAKRGYSVKLILSGEQTSSSVSGAYNRLADEAVDGIIMLYEAGLLDHGEALFPPGLPVLVIGSTRVDSLGMTVDVNQEQGARLATQHLVGLGHRDIWHIAGPMNGFAARKREDTWRAVLSDNGLQSEGRSIPGDWTADSGYAAGLFLGDRDDVTAVFAANDSIAIGLIRGLREQGKRVPDDISVVGFDDAPDSAFVWPPLTTVSQDFSMVGEVSSQLLLEAVRTGETPAAHSVLPTQLVVRQSTAPAPRR